MKNIFAPVFLFALLLSGLLHVLDSAVIHHGLIVWIALSAGAAALIFYIADKFKICYVFNIIAIGLIISAMFLAKKESFYFTRDSFTPPDGYITITGELTDFPDIRQDHSVIILDSQVIEFNRKKISKRFRSRIVVKGRLIDFYKGDIVTIDAKLHSPTFHRNFAGAPSEGYQLVNETHFSGYCKSSRLISLVERTSFFRQWIGKWRNKIRDAIDRKYAIPSSLFGQRTEPSPNGVFLQAILIGERGMLSHDWKERLLGAGVYHLLAISGAHIGIIALFCLAVLKLARLSPRKRYLVTALVLLVFLVLSGNKISAERAVMMALFIFTARALFLDVNIFNIISLCGILLLIRNPASFLDAGFILTFVLTAAIVIGRRIFLPLLLVLVRGKKTKEEAPAEPGMWDRFFELLSANFSASLISLPLSLFYFNRYSFAGFAAGLLLVPLTAVVTGLGLLLIPMTLVSPFFSQLLLAVIDLPLQLFFLLVKFFSGSSGFEFSIFRASPSSGMVFLILVTFFLIPFVRTVKQKLSLGMLLSILLFLVSVNVFFYSPPGLEVYFLDVGQGDSEVVVFPGGDALLIDGGGTHSSRYHVGRRQVLPFILQKRINIRWMAVSHFHPDHANGISELLPILEPDELWISSEAEAEPSFQQVMASLPRGTAVRKLTAPMTKRIGSCTLEVLYPNRWIRARRSHNNHSMVLRVSDGTHSFLFPGDIERRREVRLVKALGKKLRATVIKVPHHGSSSSSSLDFLKCVSPRTAIFSYGRNNRFRFPHREVLDRYKKLDIAIFSTAGSGGIKITSLPEGIEVETTR
jgi:competence protein ComEC